MKISFSLSGNRLILILRIIKFVRNNENADINLNILHRRSTINGYLSIVLCD